jgi:hypothetical protein
MQRHTALLFAASMAFLTACSSQQGYASARNWQRNQCSKIVDAQERMKCMREADTPYDQYKKEADAVKKSP